jgi:hypothetical protein
MMMVGSIFERNKKILKLIFEIDVDSSKIISFCQKYCSTAQEHVVSRNGLVKKATGNYIFIAM